MRRNARLTVVLFGAWAFAMVTAAPVIAYSGVAEVGTERHCVANVVGEVGGVLITGPERCYDTFGEASTARSAGVAGFSSSNTIGVHFSGTGYSGSSITIVGTTCSGGIWPASGSWNDNIESSFHYCGSKPTTFFDYSGCTGDKRAITSDRSTLYEMNNRTSCVKYG